MAGAVLFESLVVGRFVKMTAIDEASGTEAVVTGPAGAARADLEALALRKLRRVLERRG